MAKGRNGRKSGINRKLGLERASELTKKVCMDKVRFLERGIENGQYKGKILTYARYYRSWYAWKAKHLKSARPVSRKRKEAGQRKAG